MSKVLPAPELVSALTALHQQTGSTCATPFSPTWPPARRCTMAGLREWLENEGLLASSRARGSVSADAGGLVLNR
jgi:hypothetical protein